jgi:hypothetical protein
MRVDSEGFFLTDGIMKIHAKKVKGVSGCSRFGMDFLPQSVAG